MTLNREELAEKIDATRAHVSRMMGTLERIGVVFRERVKVDPTGRPAGARVRPLFGTCARVI